MRRLIRAAFAISAAGTSACASAGAPPGGPERHEPPQILAISPDSGATNVKIREVQFTFDEVVSDRPGSSAATLDQLFLISPSDGSANVSWHRSRITVRPRKGFRANTAYRVTMLPGLTDLRGNRRKDGASILFSTGAGFPPFSILGRVFDWETERPANGAYIEAIYKPDTTIVYIAATDSAGEFDVGPLPAGEYLVRGLIDQNSNRTIDRTEKWDTVSTSVVSTRPVVELDAIARDSVPPAFADVRVDDSVTIHVAFDKPIDPRLPIQPVLFTIQRPDSSRIEVASVQWASAFERSRAAADSTRRADSTKAAKPPAAQPAPPAATPAAPPGGRAAPPPPKPKSPPPERAVVLKLSPTTPVLPGNTYRITVRGFRNLVGNSAVITRTFIVAKPAPPTRADSTRRPAQRPAAQPPAATRPPRR